MIELRRANEWPNHVMAVFRDEAAIAAIQRTVGYDGGMPVDASHTWSFKKRHTIEIKSPVGRIDIVIQPGDYVAVV